MLYLQFEKQLRRTTSKFTLEKIKNKNKPDEFWEILNVFYQFRRDNDRLGRTVIVLFNLLTSYCFCAYTGLLLFVVISFADYNAVQFVAIFLLLPCKEKTCLKNTTEFWQHVEGKTFETLRIKTEIFRKKDTREIKLATASRSKQINNKTFLTKTGSGVMLAA